MHSNCDQPFFKACHNGFKNREGRGISQNGLVFFSEVPPSRLLFPSFISVLALVHLKPRSLCPNCLYFLLSSLSLSSAAHSQKCQFVACVCRNNPSKYLNARSILNENSFYSK